MIDKTSLPLVAVDEMNAIHFEEVDLLNTLTALMEKKADDEQIGQKLYELMEHMQVHFSHEEKLMQSHRYPMYRLHKGEHDKVLNEIRYVELEWRSRRDRDDLQNYLKENIPMWLDQHIKAMDSVLADFLRQNGFGS
ncbi:MAG: hemerythrin family protein [Campylobacterota bacterium]|nr:hemerythrin family protein [Campylobacterota bacterium]